MAVDYRRHHRVRWHEQGLHQRLLVERTSDVNVNHILGASIAWLTTFPASTRYFSLTSTGWQCQVASRYRSVMTRWLITTESKLCTAHSVLACCGSSLRLRMTASPLRGFSQPGPHSGDLTQLPDMPREYAMTCRGHSGRVANRSEYAMTCRSHSGRVANML